jgi:hypothetical protein
MTLREQIYINVGSIMENNVRGNVWNTVRHNVSNNVQDNIWINVWGTARNSAALSVKRFAAKEIV